jgi:diguanylate cyclase (GGDEF)-like protein/PAS domain S-box-containing protein
VTVTLPRLRPLPPAGRPVLALAVLAVGLLGLGALLVRDVRSAHDEVRRMYVGSVRGLDVIGELEYQTQEARRMVLYALTTSDPNLQVEYADRSRQADAVVADLLATHLSLHQTGRAGVAASRFQADWAAYLQVRDEVVASILEGSSGEAITRDLSEGVPSFQKARDALLEIKRLYRDEAENRLGQVETRARGSTVRVILIVALAQLLVLVAGRAVHRGLMLRAVQDSEMALRASEAKFRTLADTVASAIFIFDERRLLYVNAWTEALTGWPRETLLAMGFWDLVHPEDRPEIQRLVTARGGGEAGLERQEFRLQGRDGRVRWVDLTTALIAFEGRTATLGTAFDVTDRKRVEEQIQHQAYHDALTGLPNRMLFLDRLQIALAHARRQGGQPAVLFLDLDDFKVINDTLGHATGDRLLQGLAERLITNVREDDTVARMGGDEFTLLLPNVGRVEDAARLAGKLLEAVAQPFQIDGQDLFVTTSVGVSLYPGDGEDAETLLKNADRAMYRAKELGRNNYQLFAPALNVRAVNRLSLETRLRRALEREEFLLHYQPQVNLATRRIVGLEALIRWREGDGALLEPAEFIPVAEEARLILPLGQWILRAACKQARAWQDQGLPEVRLAVNLSARQFQQQDLIRSVFFAVRDAGLPPRRLELEITESAAMQNVDRTIGMLHGLRDMGVRISMDDFGTGHSSLSYLKRFPIDAVKIDQSFVRDMTSDPSDAAIVKAIVAMAHSLGLNVVAEGVETLAQADFLRRTGCDEMQGYLVGRPLPADEITEALRARVG